MWHQWDLRLAGYAALAMVVLWGIAFGVLYAVDAAATVSVWPVFPAGWLVTSVASYVRLRWR
jgi:hypothetical protein